MPAQKTRNHEGLDQARWGKTPRRCVWPQVAIDPRPAGFKPLLDQAGEAWPTIDRERDPGESAYSRFASCNSDSPLISGGFSSPIKARIVGAISASRPPCRRLAPGNVASTTISGTS